MEQPQTEVKENVVSKQLVTEVTSVAKEEERTGEKINVPSPEELKSRAMSSFIQMKTKLAVEFPKLSSKKKNRVMAAILDLPVDGVPVYLKEEDEKLCFALGQRMISDRFILTYYHVVDEIKRKSETKTDKENDNVEREQQ